jgi:hypothetical protein
MATASSGLKRFTVSAHARAANASAISTRRANFKSMNCISFLLFRLRYLAQLM